MLLLRTKPEKQSQITAEKVHGKFPNRKITVTPEIQTTNTTKIRPKTISCGIAELSYERLTTTPSPGNLELGSFI